MAFEGHGTLKTRVRGIRLPASAAMALMLAIGMLATGGSVRAATGDAVRLQTASLFAVLAGSPAVGNLGSTVINGALGIHPAKSVTGFPQGTVNGEVHAADDVARQAKADLASAYDDAAGRTPGVVLAGGALGGLVLTSGVYGSGAASLNLTGTLTLDGAGNPSSVWVFQAASDLATAASSEVRFINGGQACNVFWQVGASATLGADSSFAGNLLVMGSISMQSRVDLSGRALARGGAVALVNDAITPPVCFVAAPVAEPTFDIVVAVSAATPRALVTVVPLLPAADVVLAAGVTGPGLSGIAVLAIFLLPIAILGGRRWFRTIRVG